MIALTGSDTCRAVEHIPHTVAERIYNYLDCAIGRYLEDSVVGG